MAWADASYGYKKQITLLAAQIDGDETDFPMLLSMTDANLKDTVNGGHVESANGYDIVFYDSTETTLFYHEIERYINTSGEIIYWINIPSITAVGDTTIYMYYGKAGVAADPSSTDTWNSDYEGVYHLKGSGWATTDDSTSNAKDATGESGTVNYQTEEITNMGYGIDLPEDGGALDRVNFEQISITGATNKLTISAWCKIDALHGGIYESLRNYGMYFGGIGHFTLALHDAGSAYHNYGVTNAGAVTTGLHYLAGTYDGSEAIAGFKLYVDGSADLRTGGRWDGGWTDTGAESHIGNFDNTFFYDGDIDEVRISSIDRSVSWAITEYNNQSDPSNFYTIGSESDYEGTACTCGIFTLTGTTYAIELTKPSMRGEDNGIIKELKSFSFQSENYALHDDGINSQPLILTGIEESCGEEEQTKRFQKINEMMDNHEEITISGLGDCMDAVYVIKNFGYKTIKNSDNAYSWTITLEKVRD